jgi:hypothetical protein
MHSSRKRTPQGQPNQRGAGKQSPEPDFDTLPHNHKDLPASDADGSRSRELRDHERGIGAGFKPHPKRMPMQAAPDHGDHYE